MITWPQPAECRKQLAATITAWPRPGRLLNKPTASGASHVRPCGCGGGLASPGEDCSELDGILPEALLFAVSLAALLINPGPFPYDLLNLVPFAFLFAFRYASMLWKEIGTVPFSFQ